ncbi:hypothetical protein GQ44DRAFT_565218, partial [Phaeosphaeriaceae sp. PMI808]
MATPTQQPPIPPEQRFALEQKARYDNICRNVAIAGIIACPILILLPPRKIDMYTFALGVGTVMSADHLLEVRTGRGILGNLANSGRALPTERAEEIQRKLKEERDKGRKMLEKDGVLSGEPEKEKSILTKLWMGEEKEGWQERRAEAERKALAEGKMYRDIIFGQIWEVWNWDKK